MQKRDYSDFFDGNNWNRTAVVGAQRNRAAEQAKFLGVPTHERSFLGNPIEESFVEKFEELHSVNLPTQYRNFLLEVGEGGAGPGLYMRRLGRPIDDTIPWQPGHIDASSTDPNCRLEYPFPWDDHQDFDPRSIPHETTDGALFLFDFGSSMWDLLIVTGYAAGEVWMDRIVNSQGLTPRLSEEGRRIEFAEYYCSWLNNGLTD